MVLLDGKREVYQGNPQVKIMHLRLAKPEEPHEPSQYMEKAPLRKEEMEEEISQTLFEITNPHWNRIVRFLLNKYKRNSLIFQLRSAITMPSPVDWRIIRQLCCA